MDKRQKGFSFMIGPIRRTLPLIVLSRQIARGRRG